MSMSFSNAHPPWGYLADDVLQEIFIFSVTGTDKRFGRLVLDSHRPSFRQLPQLSISHVCSTWRQVSLLTPRLWNRVCIIYVTHFNTLNLIGAEWLSRTRNVPVSIQVVQVEPLAGDEESVWHSFLISLLSPHRIQHLEIQSAIHIPLPDLSAQSVADLETLSIVGFDDGCIDLSNKRYPNLTHLSLFGNWKLLRTCNSLRKFNASKNSLTVSEVWSFLSGCQLLEECYISIKRDNSGRLPIATNLYLPSLRILQLAFPIRHPDIPLSSMLEPFSLPHLETFDIVDSSFHWSTPAFAALASRSNGLPHLETFALRKSKIIVEGAPLLALIPSVTRVSLCSSEASIGEAVLDGNTLDRLASGLLGPRPKELIVGYISNLHQFMGMVESRMENAQKCNDGTPVSFTKVRFRIEQRYANISRRLNNMQQRGIPIDVLISDDT